MTRYAQNTSVDSSRTKAEIERTVMKYGANGFVSGWQGEQATIMFDMSDRRVRFTLHLPDKKNFELSEAGRKRKPPALEQAWEQACRQAWRALALVVKAKLEAVESGITTFDEEFLAHIVLPGTGGATVGDKILSEGGKFLGTGKLPPLLGGHS